MVRYSQFRKKRAYCKAYSARRKEAKAAAAALAEEKALRTAEKAANRHRSRGGRREKMRTRMKDESESESSSSDQSLVVEVSSNGMTNRKQEETEENLREEAKSKNISQKDSDSEENFLEHWTQKEMENLEVETVVAYRSSLRFRSPGAFAFAHPATSAEEFPVRSPNRLSSSIRSESPHDHSLKQEEFLADDSSAKKLYRDNSCQTIVSYGNKEYKPKRFASLRCSVPGCEVESGRGVTVYSFPCPIEEPRRRAEWIRRIGLEEKHLSPYSRVCRWHFDDKYIRPKRRGNLSADAVPMEVVIQKEEEQAAEESESSDRLPADYSDDLDGGGGVSPSGFAAISVKQEENEQDEGDQQVDIGAYSSGMCSNIKHELDDDEDIDPTGGRRSVATSVHTVYADPLVKLAPRRPPVVIQGIRPPPRSEPSTKVPSSLPTEEPDEESTNAEESTKKRSCRRNPTTTSESRLGGTYKEGCVVPGCGVVPGRGIPLFNIPLEPSRRAVWLRNIGLERARVRKYAKVCRLHFADKCVYYYTNGRSSGLVIGAVPMAVGEQTKAVGDECGADAASSNTQDDLSIQRDDVNMAVEMVQNESESGTEEI